MREDITMRSTHTPTIEWPTHATTKIGHMQQQRPGAAQTEIIVFLKRYRLDVRLGVSKTELENKSVMRNTPGIKTNTKH